MRVPQDLSIIGFDNIEVGSFYSPPLTSVKVPSYDLGRQGAELLLQTIQDGKTREPVTLPTELIIRNSISKMI
jgi:DNA-binding LacI/PurR family transcriptional regulator